MVYQAEMAETDAEDCQVPLDHQETKETQENWDHLDHREIGGYWDHEAQSVSLEPRVYQQEGQCTYAGGGPLVPVARELN